MVRVQIKLTEKQAALLRRRAADQGVSLAEVIRRGVDIYLRGAPLASD